MDVNSQIGQLYQPLYVYVKNRINHLEDAQDITQEVFLKLSKSDVSKVDNVKSWVYTIARNTITDYYRKRKMYFEEAGEMIEEEQEDDTKVLNDLSACIDSYIKQLPEDYSQLMLLSEIEEIPQKEIAAQLGVNYTTVRSKIQRGRKKVRDLFEECCVFDKSATGGVIAYHPRGQVNCDDCGTMSEGTDN